MKGSIIILLIFESWKICFPIYIRYSIWKTRNVSTIHRSIPCRQRTHLDKWIKWFNSSNLAIFWQWSCHRNSKNWILRRWSHQVKDAQPCWYMTVLHHQQSNLKICHLYPGNIWTFVPQQRRQFVNTQNVPRLWKVDPRVTAKTTLECISVLIQSERDLSLFTKFLYSRIFNQRPLEGQISNRTSLFL